jgi:putative heme-binding domain-containing protein
MRFRPAQSAAALLGLLACCVWWSHMPMLRAAENVAPARPARPAWTSSTVKGTPEPPPPLRARTFYEHVRFKNPTSLTTAPGSDRFFVTEHYGGIYSIPKDPACPQADPFIDIHALLARLNERVADPLRFGAVYGLTFHPNFATNRFCYLCYTVGYKDESRGAYPNGTRVVRLTVTEENGVPRCDPASEVEIITWPAGGHNGGCLWFGPDGCLYISAGDGGATLSATGLFADTSRQKPASGVLCFDIQAEAWADHATSQRFIGVPGDGQVEFYSPRRQVPGSMFSRTLFFPTDTVFAKTFFMAMDTRKPESPRPIETQLLHFDGSHWHGYTYAWNDAGTDADLVAPEGKQLPLVIKDAAAPGGVRTQTWRFFGRNECLRCHNAWAETTLAFTVPQLNRDIVVDGVRVNQLQSFRDSGFIKDMVVEPNLDENPFATVARPGPTKSLPRLADPTNTSEPIEARARAYLHVNCASCHRFGGGSVPHLHLNIDLPLGDVTAVGMQPSQGGFGIPDPKVIAAGDPFRSTLLYRMSTVGPGRMPHIGSEIVDDRGLALIHDWIARLPANFADSQLIEHLVKLDEATVLTRESREAPQQRWRRARQLAKEDGRERPEQADVARAEEERRRQAADRALAREQERERLTSELLSSTSRAVMLAGAIRQGRLPSAIRSQTVAAALRHPEPVIAGLFEDFVPADQRVKRLGTVVDPAAILALSGDAARGRRLYHEAASLQCRNCHMIGDAGREVGPPLTAIGGKLDRAKLLESLLEPSKTIDPKYQSWVVETTDGRVVTGLVVSKTDTSVVLRDAENKTLELPMAEIEQMEPQKVSLMPEHLLRDLTAAEAVDLLAYLESLRTQ